MSDKPVSKSRRNAVKLMLGTAAAVPVMNLVGVSVARAEAPANAVSPDWQMAEKIAAREARVALAELKQAAELIPNSTVLVNALPLLEARASSEIES